MTIELSMGTRIIPFTHTLIQEQQHDGISYEACSLCGNKMSLKDSINPIYWFQPCRFYSNTCNRVAQTLPSHMTQMETFMTSYLPTYTSANQPATTNNTAHSKLQMLCLYAHYISYLWNRSIARAPELLPFVSLFLPCILAYNDMMGWR